MVVWGLFTSAVRMGLEFLSDNSHIQVESGTNFQGGYKLHRKPEGSATYLGDDPKAIGQINTFTERLLNWRIHYHVIGLFSHKFLNLILS